MRWRMSLCCCRVGTTRVKLDNLRFKERLVCCIVGLTSLQCDPCFISTILCTNLSIWSIHMTTEHHARQTNDCVDLWKDCHVPIGSPPRVTHSSNPMWLLTLVARYSRKPPRVRISTKKPNVVHHGTPSTLIFVVHYNLVITYDVGQYNHFFYLPTLTFNSH